jgi:3-oxoacyl-[acyl-carrier-protein] synthase II
MMNCSVTGFGWVAVDGLGEGKSGTFHGFSAGELAPVTRQDLFDRPDRRFGRMDSFSKLGLAAITFALRDAGLEEWQEKRSVGILADTFSGCFQTDCDYFNSVIPDEGVFASPQLFAYTLSNTFLGEAALRFGLTGNCQVVNCCADDGLAVIRQAIESIHWGEDERVVVGFCELSSNGALNAPGALFMVLEAAAEARSSLMALTINQQGAMSCHGKPVVTVTMLVEVLAGT